MCFFVCAHFFANLSEYLCAHGCVALDYIAIFSIWFGLLLSRFWRASSPSSYLHIACSGIKIKLKIKLDVLVVQ